MSLPLKTLEAIARQLRIDSLRATTAAGSGHPTTCLSAADLVAAIFFHAMRFDSQNPRDPEADRFVLSKGHASPLLWAVWAAAGAIPREELLNLRKQMSNLEGHPTPRFPWVDVATGSLGQGLSAATGMALNFLKLDKNDARAFCLLGDGECAEGSVWEAASFASYYGLGNLVAVVDTNGLGQSQATMFEHDVDVYRRRFESFGWSAETLDGHNMKEIVAALDRACRRADRPWALIAKTIKGKGVSFLEGKEGWHGKALKPDELEKALKEIGELPSRPDVKTTKPPRRGEGSTPSPREPEPPTYTLGALVATRSGYGDGLVKLGRANPKVVALDGDTKNSTYSERFAKAFPARFFECFIAEQNMVGVAAGLAARGKIPFVSTFGCFLTRAFDQIRMAAISGLPIKFAGSHAGISIGEDGPSQMALEDLAMMRAIPNMAVLYPSDAVAAERLVAAAATYPGMAYIRTGRPATPVIYPNETLFPIGGCKVLKASNKDQATIVAAGITLTLALKAYDLLQREGIPTRIIDLYSLKPIDTQTLTKAATETNGVLTVEDHYPEGGLGDAVAAALAPSGARVIKLAVNQVPRSGKPEELIEMCGIGAGSIVRAVKSLIH